MIDPTPSCIDLPDGRRIAYVEGGDPDGVPVIGLHGTPGCRLSRWPDDGLYARAGVRYVTTDRAGYGRSTRHHGRRVADEAADVLAVADALGLDRFAVVGGSGGGPHALACAALLSGRVTRVACQSSLAPVGVGGMTRVAWLQGMPDDGAELRWAEDGEARVEAEATRLQAEMVAALDADPTTLLGEAGSGGADAEFLARPDLLDNWRRIVAEQAVDGVAGSVDDYLAFSRPWGFSLASIDVPVLLTHGEQDASCPIAHARWLAARIRGVTTDVSATGGHLPEDAEAEITATMTWLRG